MQRALLFLKQRFSDGHVKWRGDFDVLAVAFDESDVEAESFYHAGVVGKAVVVGLFIRCLQQLDVKTLRRLYQTVVTARLRSAL